MRTALKRMGAWLVVVGVLALVGLTSLIPPGNEWTPPLTLALISLVLGAYHTAGAYRGRLLFFLYGCLGGCFMMPVFLPDRRDEIAIAWGQESIWSYVLRALAFVPLMGVACSGAAVVRHWRLDALARRADPRRCRKCGYWLYGLPGQRCPECGTPFDGDVPSSPP
jgi:hypothetical protein